MMSQNNHLFLCSWSVIIINIFPTAILWNAGVFTSKCYIFRTPIITCLRRCKVRPEMVLGKHSISELEGNLEINSHFASGNQGPQRLKFGGAHTIKLKNAKLEIRKNN